MSNTFEITGDELNEPEEIDLKLVKERVVYTETPQYIQVKRRNAYRKLSDAPQPFAPIAAINQSKKDGMNNLVEVDIEPQAAETKGMSEEEQFKYLREWEKGIVALKFGRKGPKQRKFQINMTSGSLICSHGFGNFAQPDLGDNIFSLCHSPFPLFWLYNKYMHVLTNIIFC